MTSPACTVNATATTNGVDLTPATTATIALADVAGVKQWSILAVDTDELNLAASINATLVVDSITKTATFTVPAAGSAVRFESVVNNGRDINDRSDPSLTARFAVYTLTATGYRVAAFNETLEGNAAFGWITKFNALVRGVAVNPASGGAGMTFSAGAYNVGANADGSIIVNADDIQVGILATDAQHGNRGNGSLHTVATSIANGFMPSSHWSLVNGATSLATPSAIVLRDGSGDFAANTITASKFTVGATSPGRFVSDDVTSGATSTGSVIYKSGNQSATGNSGSWAGGSGVGFATSGAVSLVSGVSDVSGNMTFSTGASTTTSGLVAITTGSASTTVSGAISATTGSGPATGNVTMTTGVASVSTSGSVSLTTGAALGNAGNISLTCGASSGIQRGGTITLTSGGSVGGANRGGDIALVAGLGAAGYGNIALGAIPANYGNGNRVTAIPLSSARPTASVVGYYILFTDPSDLHKLKVRGPSGTVTTLAIA